MIPGSEPTSARTGHLRSRSSLTVVIGFWNANPRDTKAMVPIGPNNPVGIVWIDIFKKHYGLHGTPPGTVDDRPHAVARLRAAHQLGRAETGRPGEARHAGAV